MVYNDNYSINHIIIAVLWEYDEEKPILLYLYNICMIKVLTYNINIYIYNDCSEIEISYSIIIMFQTFFNYVIIKTVNKIF